MTFLLPRTLARRGSAAWGEVHDFFSSFLYSVPLHRLGRKLFRPSSPLPGKSRRCDALRWPIGTRPCPLVSRFWPLCTPPMTFFVMLRQLSHPVRRPYEYVVCRPGLAYWIFLLISLPAFLLDRISSLKLSRSALSPYVPCPPLASTISSKVWSRS